VKVDPAGARYGVAAVDRAVLVLEALERERNPLTLAQIARRTGLSEATALRYLSSLGRHELVERDSLGRYRLGIALFRLGQRALGELDPRKVALPYMDRLLEQFGETVNLAMRHGDEIVLIEVLESSRSIKKGATVGERDIWHASALGKAILAHLSEPDARGVLASLGYPTYTEHTLVSYEALAASFDDVRELGYAMDDEEFEIGLRCIGAPVFDQRGKPTYALSLSAPASRVPPELVHTLGQAIAAAAAQISTGLGHLVEAELPIAADSGTTI
jgi:IclR family acetate operon transcriptional repressor